MRHVGPKLEAVKLLISSVADGKWLKRVGDEIVGVDQPGAEVFTDLSDVPSDYTSQGGKFVAVNSGATALEFVDAPADGGIQPEEGVIVIKHGANGSESRPTAAQVFWMGSVAPTNRVTGDLWLETGAFD